MSQMATARALPRLPVARQRPAAPRDLHVVVGVGRSNAALVAVALLFLTGGLVAVLLLNTWMAQSAFTLTALQQRADELKDTEAALQHDINTQSAPAELARRALDQGMVPASTAAFLRLSDGEVLGVAEPATGQRGFTVVAQAVPPAPAADSVAPTATATLPEAGTTVTTEGTITRTTVVAVTAEVVETTVTSVDSASGATTSTTTRTPIPQATAPEAAVAPTP